MYTKEQARAGKGVNRDATTQNAVYERATFLIRFPPN